MTSTMRLDEAKPSTTIAARMPIAAMLTPNPRESKSASHSGSSSGKRRRARSTKSEAQELARSQAGGAERAAIRYESPYARIEPAGDDSPARAAILRHREDYPNLPRTASLPPITTSTAADGILYPHGHPKPT
jgi:hypothetical protein